MNKPCKPSKLPVTKVEVKLGDFPIGSALSRAAARLLLSEKQEAEESEANRPPDVRIIQFAHPREFQLLYHNLRTLDAGTADLLREANRPHRITEGWEPRRGLTVPRGTALGASQPSSRFIASKLMNNQFSVSVFFLTMPGEMAKRLVEAKTEEHWPEGLDSDPMGRMIPAYILNRGGARTIQSHSLRLILSPIVCRSTRRLIPTT